MVRYIQLEALLRHLTRVGFHVKDIGLLDSALNRPRASAFGEDAYLTLAMKAAAQTQSIIKNHPMVDGNKRTSWLALNAFLGLNGYLLQSSQDDSFTFVIQVATDEISLQQIAFWIEEHMVELRSL